MRMNKIVIVLTMVASTSAFAKGEAKDAYKNTRARGPKPTSAMPKNWGEVRTQTAQRVGATAGHVVNAVSLSGKTGKRAALTVAGASGILALAAIDASAITHMPQIAEQGLQHAQNLANEIITVGKDLAAAGPAVGIAAGVGAASYVAAPTAKYMGKGVVRVWMKGGPAVDMGIGAFHYALTLAATQDPMYAAAVGGNAAFGSNIARWLTPGAEKLGSSLPRGGSR